VSADVGVDFARASAVTSAALVDGQGTYDIAVDPGWVIGDKPNGGYLLATMARAAVAATGTSEGPAHPHPISASATYIASPTPGPAQVQVEVLRRGRRMSQARARLVRDGATYVEATFTLGRLVEATEPWWSDVPAPDIPPPEECVAVQGTDPTGIRLPIMDRVDIRLDPAVTGFRVGRPGGGGELRGWLRFRDGHVPDPVSLLYVLDAFPPATFELATTGWVPTLALTAYVRAVPAPGPVLVRQRAALVEADLVDEVCHVWDGRGRLVAQATQLAGIRVGDAVAPPTGAAGEVGRHAAEQVDRSARPTRGDVETDPQPPSRLPGNPP
jgi:Acyl-CoA thioesterase C-terminal domain/Acyl-CoA thioesterase N-terminal domain